MSDRIILEQAQKICRNLLDLDPPETIEKINDAIDKVSKILPLDDADKDILLSRLKEVTGITQDAPRILDKEDKIPEPWTTDKWSKIADKRRFWRRYQNYLSDEQKIAPKVISRLEELTDKILDRLADPEAHDQFDKRGLVVGNVQSGKTQNYIGLITKAADAGYKLIVVLAGIHSSLRSQTQLRIDEGFLGYDTQISRSFNQASNRIGVGRIDPNVPAHSLTSSDPNGDFRRNVAETVNFSLKGSDPIIVVIKKNYSVLKNLIQWLAIKEGEDIPGTSHKIIKNIPLLLIDDEADNASINISEKSVSSINGAIRALLRLFRKSAYVGYTATPYANVFIPLPDEKEEDPGKGVTIPAGNMQFPVGEDLFPRDFIINIPPPSNYIGPEKFFDIVSEDELYEQQEEDQKEQEKTSKPAFTELYEPVSDYQPANYSSESAAEEIRTNNLNFIPDTHKKDDAKPKELPESLKAAIRSFILACAARRVRGQVNVHNSMLVHVTRFVDWQNHIALLVEEELMRYKNRIEFRNAAFLGELRLLWERNFVKKTREILRIPGQDSGITEIDWVTLEPEILPAVTKIRVRAVHGSKQLGGLEFENIQPLDYYDNQKSGLSVIAVGGNKLSRGLTLEGLTISYFLRASKMYDTLMQMGRWFGYRPGYLDLCRLFTTSDLVSHYKLVTAATVEMRAEFDRMSLLRKKPENYGLKVRADVGVLTITAANKFRYKKMMYFGFSGDLEETWQFDKTQKEIFEKNHLLTRQFIEKLGRPDGPANTSKYLKSQRYVWQRKNNSREVMQFLGEYQSSQPSFITSLMREYIEAQAENSKLINWTIALIDNQTAKEEARSYFGDHKLGWSYRKDDAEEGSRYFQLSKAHIIGNFHEYVDLDDDQLERALENTRKDKKKEGKESPTVHPSPVHIRRERNEKNGLLLIYPLDPRPNKEKPPYSNVPIIGLAISYPEIPGERKVRYAVNEVFQKELYNYPDELDNDDLDPDEDENDKGGAGKQRSSLSPKVFEKLIENSFQQALKPTEFSEGMVPEYPGKDDDIVALLRSHKSLVLSPEKTAGQNSLPFYLQKDLQQFYLDPAKQVVVNAENKYIAENGCIAGLKQSKYVTFCFQDQPAVFSDSCWVIRPEPAKARYMTALFNSPVFGAWVRVKGDRKKDRYFINNEVLENFPLVLPEEDKVWIYDILYELLVAAAKKERGLGTEKIRNYYAEMLNGLIFCTYFPDSLKEQKNILEGQMASLLPRELPKNGRNPVLAEELYTTLYDSNHPVRKTLYFLDDKEKVKRIRSVFTR